MSRLVLHSSVTCPRPDTSQNCSPRGRLAIAADLPIGSLSYLADAGRARSKCVTVRTAGLPIRRTPNGGPVVAQPEPHSHYSGAVVMVFVDRHCSTLAGPCG